MNIHLVLTYEWFDEVLSGRKRIEYREVKPYWRTRIWDRRNEIRSVSLSRGYTYDTLNFGVSKIDIGECPYVGWNGKYYRIHLFTTGSAK